MRDALLRPAHLVAGVMSAVLLLTATPWASGQEQRPQFGGGYAELDARRQLLVNDWVTRLVNTTAQPLEPHAFYDDMMSLSAKVTFEAVTHALQQVRLTDRADAPFGDALSLIERIDYVSGEVIGAASDRQ